MGKTDDEFERYVTYLAVPHRARTAYEYLLANGDAALPAVRRGLRSASAEVRNDCAKILGQIGDDESFADLVALVDDEDARIRWNALHAFTGGDRADAHVVRRVIGVAADDAAWEVRGLAIDVLAQWMHDDGDAAAAIAAARDGDDNAVVRKKAASYCPPGLDLRDEKAAPQRSGSKR